MVTLGIRGTGLGDDLTSILNSAGQYVTNAAETGAQAAIPQIQQQVQTTVEPYVLASLALGLLGVMFGLSGFLAVRKFEKKHNLSGRRR